MIIITHAAKDHLARCLPPVLGSSLRPRVLVVNSSSQDGTVEAARGLGAETLVVPRREFNHGATREKARKHLGTPIVVMLTPDAYLENEETLGKLVQPLLEERASVSYARQTARVGADFFESFPRQYNYPATSHVRSIADVATHGVYTFFCSNSCAAYRNTALDEIGGFQPVLTNEDYFAAARLLRQGHKIAYVAEAVACHSHRYTLLAEFRRYFDTGYVRAENPWVNEIVGQAEKRGLGFASAMLRELARTKPWLIPYAMAQTGAKWAGYRTGFLFYRAPVRLKRRLSAQDYYWTSEFCHGAERDATL